MAVLRKGENLIWGRQELEGRGQELLCSSQPSDLNLLSWFVFRFVFSVEQLSFKPLRRSCLSCLQSQHSAQCPVQRMSGALVDATRMFAGCRSYDSTWTLTNVVPRSGPYRHLLPPAHTKHSTADSCSFTTISWEVTRVELSKWAPDHRPIPLPTIF